MQFEVGSIVEGVVTGITAFGAFVSIGEGQTGLVHISEIAEQYVSDVSQHLQNGQKVRVKILGTNNSGKLNLSIRKALPPSEQSEASSRANNAPRPNRNNTARGGKPPQNRERRENQRGNSRRPQNDMGGETRYTKQPAEFEDMLSKFMHSSDEKLSGMRKQPTNRRSGYHK